MSDRAAVGVANHNGWAHLVTMAWADDAPTVIDRRRVPLVGDGLPNQPYEWQAPALPRDEAQALVDAVRRSAEACALDALATLMAELEPAYQVVTIAMRAYPFDALPADVGEALDYKPYRYIADAILYVEALVAAAQSLGLAVSRHAKGEEFAAAARTLGVAPADAEAWLKALSKQLGPPWTAEHQRAAAAAIGLLVPG